MELFWMFILQAVLIFLNAVFACAEIAVLSIGDARLEKMVEDGDKRARRLQKITKQPARFLATIQVAITLSGFLASAFAADSFAAPLVAWLLSLGVSLPASVLNAMTVVVITLLLSYFTLIFGELVPKRIAMRKSEGVALALSSPIVFISKLFAPIVWLLTVSTNGVLRLLGIDPEQNDEQVDEEDIRMMVDVGNRNGAIDNEEKEFIQNVFEFDDLTAEEIATHRTDTVILWTDESTEEWQKKIHESRHTIYPVCGESADDVLGILNAKDYFRLEKNDRESVMAVVKAAYFVPSGVKADVLFRNMKNTKNRFAIVLDEYGGMAGIVTVNDLLERLVGDFATVDDETPPEEADIEALPDGTWNIRGTAPLEDVEKALSITLDSEDCDTFGGLVFANLGAVPEDGTTCRLTIGRMDITVLRVEEHQMDLSHVTLLPQEENEEDGDSEN